MSIPIPDGSVLPSSVEWRILGNSTAFVSPFTGHAQTAKLAPARWSASFSYPQWQRYQIAAIEAFLAALEDANGRFTSHRHDRPTPRGGIPTGTPVVDAAGGTVGGNTLAVRGWPASTLVLQAGDMLGVASMLLMVTANATTDATGRVELAVGPEMRDTPADGTAIELNKPVATFMLADNDQIAFNTRGSLTDIAFTGVEVITG